ncbi:MAG: hypothetical protein RL076_1518 [Chloroflexota bacterium]|jgi:hypothetical protein
MVYHSIRRRAGATVSRAAHLFLTQKAPFHQDYGRISCAPPMRGITGEYYSPLRWGGLRANIIRPYDAGDVARTNIMMEGITGEYHDGGDYGRI